MKQFNIKECRICGETKFITAVTSSYGSVSSESIWAGENVKHIICLNCGSILHSYVEHPTRLLGHQHRMQYEQEHRNKQP